MTSSDSTLVVTENCNLAVCIVVRLHLLGNGTASSTHLLEHGAHGVRGVVSTEHLGGQSRHVVGKMLVERRSLVDTC